MIITFLLLIILSVLLIFFYLGLAYISDKIDD